MQRPFVLGALLVQPALVILLVYDLVAREEPFFADVRTLIAAGLAALSRALGLDLSLVTASVVVQIGLYCFLATTLAAGAAMVLGQRSSQQVRALIDLAARVRAGERSIKAEVLVSSELGELAESVNSMVKTLTGAELALRDLARDQVSILDASPVALISLDPNQNIRNWSRAAELLLGFEGDDVIGRSIWTMVPDEEAEPLQSLLREVGTGETVHGSMCKQLRKDGSIARLRRSAASYVDPATGKRGIILALEKAPDRRTDALPVAHPLTQDALTGLSNAEAFRGSVTTALVRSRRQNTLLGVLCLTVDRAGDLHQPRARFVNDLLLQAVADRLCELVREGELIARLGGNEFALLQTRAVDNAEVSGLARRILRELSKPYLIEHQEVAVRIHVGVAVAPQHGADADALIKNASMALDRARLDGSDQERFFEAKMHEEIEKRRALERDLAKALPNGELVPFYQPLVNLDRGHVVGCEALLRWRHPQRGFISPAEFVPIAEETGLIIQIGEWVLRQACHDATGWPMRMKVAVNLSPVQFRNPNLVPTVMSALASSGLAPDRLELEITESVLMQDSTENLEVLHNLRKLGVRIAMDDFGTGYSSLGYLRSFPLHKIKIDRTFVKDLPQSLESLAVVRAVTGLAESLGLSTTAEGIETEQQLMQVRALGVTEGQGFLFSRPIPAAEVHGFLVGASMAAKRSA